MTEKLADEEELVKKILKKYVQKKEIAIMSNVFTKSFFRHSKRFTGSLFICNHCICHNHGIDWHKRDTDCINLATLTICFSEFEIRHHAQRMHSSSITCSERNGRIKNYHDIYVDVSCVISLRVWKARYEEFCTTRSPEIQSKSLQSTIQSLAFKHNNVGNPFKGKRMSDPLSCSGGVAVRTVIVITA